jgi:hypothetical protein
MLLIGMFDSPYVRRVAITLKLLEIPFDHGNWSARGAPCSLLRVRCGTAHSGSSRQVVSAADPALRAHVAHCERLTQFQATRSRWFAASIESQARLEPAVR